MLTLAVTRRRRGATAHDQAYYVEAEREACAALNASGCLRGVLRRSDGRGVALLIEAVDATAARSILDALPTIEMDASGYTAWAVEPVGPDFAVTVSDSPNGARN